MIKVIKPGLHTSFQDLGRYGYRAAGIPVSGVMDSFHAQLANQILGNSASTPVLEIMLQGPILEFQEHTEIVVTGADCTILLNEQIIHHNEIIKIKPNDRLEWKSAKNGVFSYLSVKNGFSISPVLKSYAYHPDIYPNNLLKKGALIEINPFTESEDLNAKVSNNESLFQTKEIEVYAHAEFQKLEENQQKILLNTAFNIGSDSNRMAYSLGEIKNLPANEIITAPVQPGTVQLTPSGKIFVLMRDAQTTGGYARIFQLTENSINILAQKRTHQKVKFKLIKD